MLNWLKSSYRYFSLDNIYFLKIKFFLKIFSLYKQILFVLMVYRIRKAIDRYIRICIRIVQFL